MKMKDFYKLVAVVSLAFSSIATADNHDKPKILMSYDHWPPYQTSDDKQQPVGLDIDVFVEVMKRMGYEHEITFDDRGWTNILKSVQSGNKTLSMGTSYEKSRANLGFYSTDYRKEPIMVFGSNLLFDKAKNDKTLENWRKLSLESLLQKKLRLGIIKGYNYGEDFEGSDTRNMKDKSKAKVSMRVQYRSQIVEFSSYLELAKAMMDKKIDIFLDDFYVAAFHLNKLKKEKIINIDFALKYSTIASSETLTIIPQLKRFDTSNIHIYVSKEGLKKLNIETEAFIASMNDSIKAMKSDGTLTNIKSKYFPKRKK